MITVTRCTFFSTTFSRLMIWPLGNVTCLTELQKLCSKSTKFLHYIWPKMLWASVSIWPNTGSIDLFFSLFETISLCYIVISGYLLIPGPHVFCIRAFHLFSRWLVGSYLCYQYCSSVLILNFMYHLNFPFIMWPTTKL